MKSKAELWKEVKILSGCFVGAQSVELTIHSAFTRTLTVIYSTTLLTLFTHIQLSILGRSKYVRSIIQAEQEERIREQMLGASILTLLSPEILTEEEEIDDAEIISEETERKYLTLGWWILHVGWKDVGERVQRGVEEVFEG